MLTTTDYGTGMPLRTATLFMLLFLMAGIEARCLTNDLVVLVTEPLGPISLGQHGNLKLTVSNAGPSVAESVVLMNRLPAGAAFIGAYTHGGSCTQAAGVVSCTLEDLPTGSVAQVTIEWRAVSLGSHTNIATVHAAGIDATPADNSVSAIRTVVRERFISLGRMHSGRLGHTATPLLDGRLLMVGIWNSPVTELFDPSARTFQRTGDLPMPLHNHSATLLLDGRVLIVGGGGSFGSAPYAYLYDPFTGQFTRTAGDILTYRTPPMAARLADGRVLIAGGSFGELRGELFDPVTGFFAETGSMLDARIEGTATVLTNGQVLVAGGFGGPENAAGAELFNLSTGIFSRTGSLNQGRYGHVALALPNGSVLFVGGAPAVEVCEPGGGAYRQIGSLLATRFRATATLMSDQKVLIVGGSGVGQDGMPAPAEIFDLATSNSSYTASLSMARYGHTASLLADGTVLIAGGDQTYYNPMDQVELFDPAGIVDVPSLSVLDASAAEGTASLSNKLNFLVRLSKASTRTVRVDYVTVDGTASTTAFGVGANDYLPASGWVTFSPGSTQRLVQVTIIQDAWHERDESVFLILTNATDVFVVDAEARGVIVNDDAPPVVSVQPISQPEGNIGVPVATFSLNLSSASALPVQLDYSTADGSAQAGVDYVGQSGVLTYAPGETNKSVGVNAIGDVTVEPDETFYLRMLRAQGVSLSSTQALATLRNDDGFSGEVASFGWSAIPSPQAAGVGFAASIAARDQAGNVATSFNRTVELRVVTTNVVAGNLDFEAPSLAPWQSLPGGSLGLGNLVRFDVDGDGVESTAVSFRQWGVISGLEQSVWLTGGVSYQVRLGVVQRVETGGCWAGRGSVVLELGPTNAVMPFRDMCFGQSVSGTLVLNLQPSADGWYPLRVLVDQTPYGQGVYSVYVDHLRISSHTAVPSMIATFTQGAWSGQISIQQPGDGLRLLADDGDGHTGPSAAFDVWPLAELAMGGWQPPGRVNETFAYAGSVQNYGPDTARGVWITNIVDPRLTLLNAQPSQGSCTVNDHTVVCALGDVPAGVWCDVRMTVRASTVGDYSNYVSSVATRSLDISLFNNSGDLRFPVLPPLVRVFPARTNEAQGGSMLGFLLTLSSSNSVPASIEFTAEDREARAGRDFVVTSSAVLFPPGVTSQVVSVMVLEDSVDEEIESFLLRLTNAVNLEIDPAYQTAQGIIEDINSPPSVSILDAAMVEGDSGFTNMVFTIVLSGPSERLIRVTAASAPGTALQAFDFNPTNVIVYFVPGVTTNFMAVPVRGNTVNEPDETVLVVLSNPTNAVLGRTPATGTILNDDLVPGRLDHFVFADVPTLQFMGRPFPVEIRAVDAFGELVADYIAPQTIPGRPILEAAVGTGTVNVPMTVVPSLHNGFTGGVWRGTVSLPVAFPGVVLKANDLLEHVGQSNPFGAWSRLPFAFTLGTNAVSEGAGLIAGIGRIGVTIPRTADVVFDLNSGDTNEALTPATVVLPAGQTNVLFDLSIIDDLLLDGSRSVSLRATHADYVTNFVNLTVHDNESTSLSLELPAFMNEKDIRFQARLVLGAPPVVGVSVQLFATPAGELSLPQSIFVPAGQTSVMFSVSAMDDTRIDGTQSVAVTARVQNWSEAHGTVIVFDNESTNLVLQMGWQGPYVEGRGALPNFRFLRLGGTLPTNLTVSLASSDSSELLVPSEVIIPAGQTSLAFMATLPDDAEFDGTQPVHLTASAPGFAPVTENFLVTDNDAVRIGIERISSPQNGNASFNVVISAYDIFGTNIGIVPGPINLTAAGDHGSVVLTFAPSGGTISYVAMYSWDTNVRLTAASTNGLTATGNPFDVLPPSLEYLPLTVNDFAWDAAGRRIYASATSNSLNHANRLVIIDPDRGRITSEYVGGTPDKIAIGPDGRFVYVSVPSLNLVRRWSTMAGTYDLDIQLEPGLVVEDMAVPPGRPEAVVISRRNTCCSPRHADTVLYDQGVARSNTPSLFTGANVIDFGTTGNRLYGYESETTSSRFFRFNVDENGITLDTTAYLWTGFNVDFKFGGGRVYATNGRIYDAETGAQVGTVPLSVPVAPDAVAGRAYYAWTVSGSNARIEITGATGISLGFIALPNFAAATTGVIRWGEEGLAVRSASDGIALVRSALVGDTDRDGLPDDWERRHFGAIDYPSGTAGADVDRDGANNLAEWSAGTNPTNALSSLRAALVAPTGGGVRITFQTVAGKRYQVERSLSLPGTWQILARDLIGDGGVRSVIDSSSPSELRQFFRVRLQP